MAPKSGDHQEMRPYARPVDGGSRWALSSIRTKLVLAFAAIATLFSLAILASESGFRALDSNLAELEAVTVPMAVATQKLSIEVRSLEQLGLNVKEAMNSEQLSIRKERFAVSMEGTRGLASDLGPAGGRFLGVLEELGVTLGGAFAIREQQLLEEDAMLESLRTARDQASTLVENLEMELIEAKAADRAESALAEIRVAIYSCGDLISQAGEARQAERLAALENQFRLESRRVTRLLVGFESPVRERLSRQFSPILERTSGLDGVFRRQAEVHRLGAELDAISAQGEVLMADLRRVALEAANAGRRDVDVARSRADRRAGRAKLAVRILFAAAMLLSLAIIVLYVHRGVGRRLRALCDDLYRLSSGDHDIEVRSGGDLELAQLAEAAEVFRKNAIELAEALASLEQKNASLLEFAHVASHDLKSPMRAISNLATWVVEDCEGLLPEASANHLVLIQERSIRMETLLEDLLRFARMGNDERIMDVVSVKEMVDEVVDLMGLPESATLTVVGGQERIRTISAPLKLTIRNLLQNSILHHDGKHQNVDVRVSPLVDGFLELTVEDDGPGIPVERQEEAFQIFRKLSASSSGTGMGLALVRRAVETMGGTIRAENREGRGVRFLVKWPATPPESAEVVETESTAPQDTDARP